MLRQEADIEVVATTGSVAEAAAPAADPEPDVVTMDFHLEDGTGHDAARAMRELYPMVRSVFLSRGMSDDSRLAAVEAGASATCTNPPQDPKVLNAIRRVAAGEMLFTPSWSRASSATARNGQRSAKA